MIALIEMFFGSKVGRWIAEAVLAAALIGGGYLYIEHRGAKEAVAKLSASSAILVKTVAANNLKTTEHYNTLAKANEEKTNEALASNAALSSQLDQRVRDFDAYRRAHPGVARPASGGSPAQPGECGDTSCGDLASKLAKAGDDLARSLGEVTVELQGCQRDRDSLTGLPKEVP